MVKSGELRKNHKWTKKEVQTLKTMAINGFSKAATIQKKLPHLSTTQIVQKLYAIKKSDPKLKLPANDIEASSEDGKKCIII